MSEPIVVEHLLDPDQRTIRVPLQLNQLRLLVPQNQSVSTDLFRLPAIANDWQWYLQIYPNGQHRNANELIVYLIVANVGQSECLERQLRIDMMVHCKDRSSETIADTMKVDKLFDWNCKVDRWVRQAFVPSCSDTETMELEVNIARIVAAVSREADPKGLSALSATTDLNSNSSSSDHRASNDDGSAEYNDDEVQQETQKLVGSAGDGNGSARLMITNAYFWSNARQLGLNILRKMLSLF